MIDVYAIEGAAAVLRVVGRHPCECGAPPTSPAWAWSVLQACPGSVIITGGGSAEEREQLAAAVVLLVRAELGGEAC